MGAKEEGSHWSIGLHALRVSSFKSVGEEINMYIAFSNQFSFIQHWTNIFIEDEQLQERRTGGQTNVDDQTHVG